MVNNLDLDLRNERHLIEPIRRTLAVRPGAFIDVGANLGQTLAKVLLIVPNRRYIV